MNFKSRSPKSVVAIVVAVVAVDLALGAPCYGQGETLPPSQRTTEPRKGLNPKDVSFYQVPLVCPAAPQIGCGSASKPVLIKLESNPGVKQAWLNRAGTIMAVVWSGRSNAQQRAVILKATLEEGHLTAKKLTGTARDQALKEFQSGAGWYRGADVDRLSEEEAGVIASRWVGRIREKITLPDAKAQALQEGFRSAIRRKLIGQSTRTETRQEMLRVCRQHLDEKDIAVLTDAFRAELEGSPDEK